MALLKAEKAEIIRRFKLKELDTGSSEVQVALLTYNIWQLTEHFKKNKKDNHGRVGLIRMVNRRRKLLAYMKKRNPESYRKIIQTLGLRK